jgi:hypothetical protein
MEGTPAIINIEETIGKTVGRRRRPPNPMPIANSTKKRAVDWQRLFPAKMPPRGVYRFQSHEDADLWLTKVTARK